MPESVLCIPLNTCTQMQALKLCRFYYIFLLSAGSALNFCFPLELSANSRSFSCSNAQYIMLKTLDRHSWIYLTSFNISCRVQFKPTCRSYAPATAFLFPALHKSELHSDVCLCPEFSSLGFSSLNASSALHLSLIRYFTWLLLFLLLL